MSKDLVTFSATSTLQLLYGYSSKYRGVPRIWHGPKERAADRIGVTVVLFLSSFLWSWFIFSLTHALINITYAHIKKHNYGLRIHCTQYNNKY